jgi:hypothetical protein
MGRTEVGRLRGWVGGADRRDTSAPHQHGRSLGVRMSSCLWRYPAPKRENAVGENRQLKRPWPGECRIRQECEHKVGRQGGAALVLFQFFRLGNSWIGSLCFGGGGRAWFFISHPALWAELALRAGALASPPSCAGLQRAEVAGTEAPEPQASFPASFAEQLGRRGERSGADRVTARAPGLASGGCPAL